MSLQSEVKEAINKVAENRCIPDQFARLLRIEGAYKPQSGPETNAKRVTFGPAQNTTYARWLLFYECPENEAKNLAGARYPGLRFDLDCPFSIPFLANERQVKYYLNTNFGYGPEILSLQAGLKEYERISGRAVLDE